MKYTDAFLDVGRGMACIRQSKSKRKINFESQAWIVTVLYQHTKTFLTLLKHNLEPTATVRRRCSRLPAHVRQASGQPNHLVRALCPVLVYVGAHKPHKEERHGAWDESRIIS